MYMYIVSSLPLTVKVHDTLHNVHNNMVVNLLDNLVDLLGALDTASLPQERVQLLQNTVWLYSSTSLWGGGGGGGGGRGGEGEGEGEGEREREGEGEGERDFKIRGVSTNITTVIDQDTPYAILFPHDMVWHNVYTYVDYTWEYYSVL